MHVFLETERLMLRRLTEADADNLVELDSDPEVKRYLGDGRPTPRERIEGAVLPRMLGHYRRRDGLAYWAAVGRATGEFLGWFVLAPQEDDPPGTVELGYRLRRAAWGHGYATEGGQALLDKGFAEHGVARVYARTMAVNTRSRRVMEKLGLRHVRTFHEEWEHPLPGAEQGEVEYEITRAQWSALSRPPRTPR